MTARRRAAGLACLVASALAGCGYSFGTGLHRLGIRTVALDVVGNSSYRQRLEVELNRFLARELPVTTDLMLADHADADAILRVELLGADERTLVLGVPDDVSGDPFSRDDNDFPRIREGALEGSVRLRLVGRDGTVHVERRILDRTEFRSPLGENLTTARAELAEDLARKIALALHTEPGT